MVRERVCDDKYAVVKVSECIRASKRSESVRDRVVGREGEQQARGAQAVHQRHSRSHTPEVDLHRLSEWHG